MDSVPRGHPERAASRAIRLQRVEAIEHYIERQARATYRDSPHQTSSERLLARHRRVTRTIGRGSVAVGAERRVIRVVPVAIALAVAIGHGTRRGKEGGNRQHEANTAGRQLARAARNGESERAERKTNAGVVWLDTRGNTPMNP